MENGKADRRVVKTKKAIRDSLARLLYEKDVNNITVKELADGADISRKTFYNYYDGVYQVVDEIDSEIVSSLHDALQGVDFRHAIEHPYIIYEKLTAIINRDMDFYGYLFKMRGNNRLVAKITALLKERAIEVIRTQLPIPDDSLNTIAGYAIAGMVSAYQDWFNSDRSVPIERLSEDVGIMFFNGIDGFLRR